MKLILRSMTNSKLDIEVNDDDKIDSIRLKLIELGKTPADYVVRLISNGVILDLEKKVSDYSILKDGGNVVFMQTKKKVNQPETTLEPVQAPASAPAPAPAQAPVPVPAQAPLPVTFAGTNINLLRQIAIMSVMNRVLSDSSVFLQILLQDQNIAALRASNPTEFDNIVNHPDFLAHAGINNDEFAMNENGYEDEDEGEHQHQHQHQHEHMPELQHASDLNNNEHPNRTIRIALSGDEKMFIDEVQRMVPDISSSEIIQLFLACDKNRDATVNMVLSMDRNF
jgi:hypothetical protein